MSSKVRPAIIELTSARTKEFVRETEAIFWVFGFPLLLALALGFAFRDKAPDRIPVAVIASPAAPRQAAALGKSPALLPRVLSDAEAHDALRHGKVSLVVDGTHSLVYRFDPTSPDSRTARREADDALQSAAGRRNVLPAHDEYVHEQGARYIDFLIPGLLGMNLMGTGMWGMGFTIANARMKKLLKRLLFLRKIPGESETVHPRAAADDAQRRAARGDERCGAADKGDAPPRGPRAVGHRDVCDRVEDFPLAVVWGPALRLAGAGRR